MLLRRRVNKAGFKPLSGCLHSLCEHWLRLGRDPRSERLKDCLLIGVDISYTRTATCSIHTDTHTDIFTNTQKHAGTCTNTHTILRGQVAQTICVWCRNRRKGFFTPLWFCGVTFLEKGTQKDRHCLTTSASRWLRWIGVVFSAPELRAIF